MAGQSNEALRASTLTLTLTVTLTLTRLSAGSPGASPSARPKGSPGFKPPALSRDGSRDSNHSFYSDPGPADLREAWRNDAVYGGDTPRGEGASG